VPEKLKKQQRSYIMSRIRGKDTTIELMLRSALHRRGFRFRKHVKDLFGTPDIVFRRSKTVVFVDGDFWHGYRFPQWGATLSNFWQDKLRRNRARDRRYHARLRRAGWKVMRVWEHQIHNDIDAVVLKISALLES
jgi:DNA mismatch endonuclease, patch repair protein